LNWSYVGLAVLAAGTLLFKHRMMSKSVTLKPKSIIEEADSVTIVYVDGHGKTDAAYSLGDQWFVVRRGTPLEPDICTALNQIRDTHLTNRVEALKK